MQGDHDELEIFLEIRLIHFTNRSKVEFQRENTSLFKEEFWPKISGRLICSWEWIDGQDRSWGQIDHLVVIVASILR